MLKPFLTVLASAALCGTLSAQTPVQSDAFIDSIGINIHLSNGSTLYYSNFPLIKGALADLGIRHTRDALIVNSEQFYYDRHKELGDMGLTGVFLTDVTEQSADLKQWPTLIGKGFEGYEQPNEMDRYTNNGLGLLKSYVPVLWNAARTGADPTSVVVGPSLTIPASYAKVGDLSQYMDFGNLHTYFAGRNPGTAGWGGRDSQGNRYGSIQYALDYSKVDSGTKAIYLTETGFDMATGYANYVDETVAAIYLPRLLFEGWNSGVARTYIYELLTGEVTKLEDFGLLRADGSRRPGYMAVKNVMNMLTDAGPAFTPKPLAYRVTGGDYGLHQLLLQKRDGSYYLALWVEKPCWEPDKHYRIPVAPEAVTLTLPTTFTTATVHQWGEDGNLTDTSLDSSAKNFNLNVSDKLMIVELKPQATEYSLGITVSPASGGTVALNPAAANSSNLFAAGTVVTATATANPGYTFKGWTQGVTSTSNTINVTLASNVSLTANFACNFTLSSASTSFSGSGGSATIGYNSGSGCTAAPVSSAAWLTASSNANSIVLNAAANTSTARTATVTVGNATLQVAQAAANGTITVTLATNYPNATFNVDGKPYNAGTQLHWTPGETHVLSAPASQRPNDGIVYFYKKWNGGISGTGTTTVTAPSRDITYEADFGLGSYLVAGAAGKGTVTVSAPGVVYNNLPYYAPWQILKLTAVPSSGCAFRGWKGLPYTTPTVIYPTTTGRVVIASFTCSAAVAKN